MPKMNYCNAPCVIRTLDGWHLIACKEEDGHSGDHSCKLNSAFSNDTHALVSWVYFEVESISDNSSRIEKCCGSYIHCNSLPRLIVGLVELDTHNVLRRASTNRITNLCCELQAEHKGKHMVSGTFDLLCIKWKVTSFGNTHAQSLRGILQSVRRE